MTDGPLAPRILPIDDDRTPPPLNIFRTLARNRDLAKGFLALGGHLLGGNVLPAREREIVILRVGWRANSEYEFGQHTRIGLEAGLTTQEIERLAVPGTAGWSPADAVLVQLVDELCQADLVTEATWDALAARWSEPQLLELLVLAGFYRLVSGMLNSVGVALEPHTAGWPASAAETRRRAPREPGP
jgi:4-carboxymuconolactone decarboxylase